jgi:hypothetical protein
MKLVSFLIGLFLAGALLAENAKLDETGKQEAAAAAPVPATVPAPVNPEPPPSPCRLESRTSHSQVGNECPAGEFVTGVEKATPMTLRCAVVDVRCDAPTRFLTSDPIAPPSAATTGTPGAPGVATPERSVELLPPPPDMDPSSGK